MNGERKDELGRNYLLRTQISKEECMELELQELLFLIHSAKFFKEKEAFDPENMKEKIQVFLSAVHEKIKNAEELYMAYDKNTNYPHIDGDGQIWIFSKEEYASRAQDYYLQQLIQLDMRKINQEEIIQAFAELHRLGVKKILVDNGQYHVAVDRDEILPPPDWSGTREINIPITNPSLQHAMIRFFQNLSSRGNFEGKKQLLLDLEAIMIDEILLGRYLIPMKLIEKGEPSDSDEQGTKTLKQGTTIQFACLSAEEDTSWLPAFTDWVEFEKVYNKTEWSGNVATYEDMIALSEKMDGIVINCRGISFRINENNKKMIEDYRRQKNEPHPLDVQEHVVQKDTQIMLGEPKEYPEKMINAVIHYMKKQNRIKQAYLQLMVKENASSYLIIVDFKGSKEDLFRGIAEAATPHLNGMPLDMTEMADWVKDSVKAIQPFYKRKLLGIF